MSSLTKAAFLAKFASAGSGNFPTNTTQEIGSDDMREFATDIADSLFFDVIRSATVNVSSAEILALFTTPKTLIAAQGANTFIDVISIAAYYDFVSAAYAGAAPNDNWIGYGSSPSSNIISSQAIPLNAVADAGYSIGKGGTSVMAVANFINVPVTFGNGTANPTTGAGNITFYLTYRVLSI